MDTENTQAKSNGYSVSTYGDSSAWSRLATPHPRLGVITGKQFLRDELGLTAMEISLNSLPPGHAIPFSHGHRQNEELYLFVTGSGQMLLNTEVVEVAAGTAIRVSPPVLRCWRNTGAEALTCVVIQARAGSLAQATLEDGFVSEQAPAWPVSAP